MKILAIRGENLASLARFELDLEKGPLGEAGLFAISGPTGAGKSTLLDALCLALYDATPRLQKEGPQHILRQSAVEAYAEVDFRCDEQKRYRATWRIQRARKKPGGRWQDQTLRLLDLDLGKELGDHRKTETLRLIEQRIGLSFDQFRRAVLLAQGDFALFLQAKGDERARLLEKITGTEIYARLSEAAFRCAKEERERFSTLQKEAERYPILSDEDRAEKQAARDGLRLLRAQLSQQIEGYKKDCGWHRDRTRLREEIGEAEGQLASARGRFEAGAVLRQELLRYEQALALRPLEGAEGGAKKRREQAAEQKGAADERRARATLGSAQALAAQARAEGALAVVRQEQSARSEEIARAQALDLRIEDSTTVHLELLRAAKEAAAAAEQGRARGAMLRRDRDEGHRRQRELGAWLAERAALGLLASQWPRWEAALRTATEAWQHLDALRQMSASIEAALQQVEGTFAEAREAGAEAVSAHRRARAGLDEARSALAAHHLDHPKEVRRGAQQQLTERMQRLEIARALREEILQVEEQLEAIEGQAQAAASGAQVNQAQAAQAQAALVLAMKEQEEGERDLALLRATQELAARRPELLVMGRPCPLCGATEHPDAARAAPPTDAVRTLGAMVAALRDRGEELRARGALAEREEHTQRAIFAQAAARAKELATVRDDSKSALSAHLAALGLPAALDPSLAALGVSLQEAVRQALVRKDEILLDEQASDVLQRALDQALVLHTRSGEAAERAVAKEAAAADRRGAAERALALHHQSARAAEDAWQRARASLAEVLAFRPTWESEITSSAAALAQELAGDVAAYGERFRDRALEEQRAHDLSNEVQRAEEAQRRLEDDLGARGAALAAGAQALALLQGERAALLGGRSAAAAAAELGAAVSRAEVALSEARSSEAAVQKERAAAAEAALLSDRHLGQCERDWAEAALKLSVAMERAGLGAEELRRWLAQDESFQPQHQAAVAALREALTTAESRLEDRRRRLKEHELGQEPALSETAIEAALTSAIQRQEETASELYHVELTLSQDEQTRSHRSALEADLSTRAVQVDGWERLSDLIGSADGKKFRQFAQSLTLDILLSHSNQNLQNLRPRYRIERIPGADMDLQVVDRDMGDEVRSCATLSGGETFLSSLALALGLSSLSSKNVRVESLFIDEGFGTLDHDTLEVAIATLEQLQAGGRQVGLISHVPDLADRIGYQVTVRPRQAGHSTLTVTDGRR